MKQKGTSISFCGLPLDPEKNCDRMTRTVIKMGTELIVARNAPRVEFCNKMNSRWQRTKPRDGGVCGVLHECSFFTNGS
jgi:hypothetical protein